VTLAASPMDLPQSHPLNLYSVTYDHGFVAEAANASNSVPACCTYQYVSYHHQHADSDNSKPYFYGMARIRAAGFALEFEITVQKFPENAAKTILSIGAGLNRKPRVLLRADGTLEVIIDTASANGVTAAELGAPMELHVKYRWELQLQHSHLTVKKNGQPVFSRSIESSLAGSQEPVLVGSSSSDTLFVLEKLRLFHGHWDFSIEDPAPPLLVSSTPVPGAGSSAAPLDADMTVSFTFDKVVRPGIGNLAVTAGSGMSSTIDAHNGAEVIFDGATVRLDPAKGLANAASSVVTVGGTAVQSLGSWKRLLDGYEPQRSTPLVISSESLIGRLSVGSYNVSNCGIELKNPEIDCYRSCREFQNCTAFKVGVSGSQKGRCCLYRSYVLEVNSQFSVTAAPGELFNVLVEGDLGKPFVGIKPPDAQIIGSVSMAGISPQEFFGSAETPKALASALAENCGSPNGIPVSASTLELKAGTYIWKDGHVTTNPDVRRRLLSSAEIQYVIQLSPEQASAAQDVANAVGVSLDPTNSTLTVAFMNALSAAGVAVLQVFPSLTIYGSAPAVIPGVSPFSFLVSDSFGPSITAFEPPPDAMSEHPSVQFVLTFSEGVQAGSGRVVLTNGAGEVEQALDVQSQHVDFSRNQMTIRPPHWLKPGTKSLSMAAGVVTDDPHAGTAAPNPFLGLPINSYRFNVREVAPQRTPKETLQIGGSSGPCSYLLVEPWFVCHDFETCEVFVKPSPVSCANLPLVSRKVTYEAKQRIEEHGYVTNGEDGTLLSYGGGVAWPENTISDF